MDANYLKTLTDNQNKIKDDQIFQLLIHSIKGTYVYFFLNLNRDVRKKGKFFH